MWSWLRGLFFGGIYVGIVFVELGAAQEPIISTNPAFEVVSLRKVDPKLVASPGTSMVIGTQQIPCKYLPGMFMCQLSLVDLIEEAYHVKSIEIAGPKWLYMDFYAFKATMPTGTSRDIVCLMLQRALSDRFGIRVHREKREIPIYALVPGKHGVKLQATAPPEHRKLKAVNSAIGPLPSSISFGHGYFFAAAITLDTLADNMVDYLDEDLPVVNMTGLTGEYKIDMHWTPTEETGMKDPEFTGAVQEQLGLRLEKRKAPYDLLVVDHIERVPTEN